MHYVTNSAPDGELLFEADPHYRAFLARLACRVRKKQLRVHAFSLLPDTYHLLVEVPCGRLEAVITSLEDDYAAWRGLRARP